MTAEKLIQDLRLVTEELNSICREADEVTRKAKIANWRAGVVVALTILIYVCAHLVSHYWPQVLAKDLVDCLSVYFPFVLLVNAIVHVTYIRVQSKRTLALSRRLTAELNVSRRFTAELENDFAIQKSQDD